MYPKGLKRKRMHARSVSWESWESGEEIGLRVEWLTSVRQNKNNKASGAHARWDTTSVLGREAATRGIRAVMLHDVADRVCRAGNSVRIVIVDRFLGEVEKEIMILVRASSLSFSFLNFTSRLMITWLFIFQPLI